jgi:hypothetical protein
LLLKQTYRWPRLSGGRASNRKSRGVGAPSPPPGPSPASPGPSEPCPPPPLPPPDGLPPPPEAPVWPVARFAAAILVACLVDRRRGCLIRWLGWRSGWRRGGANRREGRSPFRISASLRSSGCLCSWSRVSKKFSVAPCEHISLTLLFLAMYCTALLMCKLSSLVAGGAVAPAVQLLRKSLAWRGEFGLSSECLSMSKSHEQGVGILFYRPHLGAVFFPPPGRVSICAPRL